MSLANPKLAALPSWVEDLRPQQIEAVEKILEAFTEHDVVVLDAPTGSGKTLIAELVRRMLGTRAVYCCSSIQLQHQFAGDFVYAKKLMGRSNYQPVFEHWDATCADCTGEECELCPSKPECPYEMDKVAALKSSLACLNTTYWLTETNGPGRFWGRGLVVFDECDLLEGELMRYVGVRISKGRAARYGLREPEKVTVASSWGTWLERTITKLSSYRVRGDDLRAQRESVYLARTISNLRRISSEIEEGWVYTGRGGEIEFKPVRVAEHAKKYVWPNGKKFLLMSATVISAGQMLDDLGWEKGYGVVTLDSTFPVENRRVKVVPAGNMSRKKNEYESVTGALEQIIERHVGERLLVHCVSYDLAGLLLRGLRGPCDRLGMGLAGYEDRHGRSEAISAFRKHEGGVLVAPSLDRGLDLPDEDCRVVVIAKVPYPYLGDRQVSARLHSKGGQSWYHMQTVRTIVQMTGRGVRHKDDWCVTYILDSQFQELYNRGRYLFPQWWKDGLDGV